MDQVRALEKVCTDLVTGAKAKEGLKFSRVDLPPWDRQSPDWMSGCPSWWLGPGPESSWAYTSQHSVEDRRLIQIESMNLETTEVSQKSVDLSVSAQTSFGLCARLSLEASQPRFCGSWCESLLAEKVCKTVCKGVVIQGHPTWLIDTCKHVHAVLSTVCIYI